MQEQYEPYEEYEFPMLIKLTGWQIEFLRSGRSPHTPLEHIVNRYLESKTMDDDNRAIEKAQNSEVMPTPDEEEN